MAEHQWLYLQLGIQSMGMDNLVVHIYFLKKAGESKEDRSGEDKLSVLETLAPNERRLTL